LITVLKIVLLQQCWARTKIIAAANPINDIPKPVRIPNPQTYVLVRPVSYGLLEWGSWVEMRCNKVMK
jgi:hypothetical protein